MFTLNIKVQGVRMEQQAPINVFYKVFAPTSDGRMVPTLIRNTQTSKAKDTFISLLAKSKSLILNITGQLDDRWVQLTPQSVLTFSKVSKDQLKENVSDIVRQIMSQISKDENNDLYSKISVDLIATNEDTNIQLQEPDQEVSEVENYESIPF